MHELLIRAASVLDGSGAPATRADVAIDGDTIAGIGRIDPARARRVIDADGLTLAPGFIDLHAHSDLAVIAEPEMTLKSRMGVTTELLGQDGLAPGSTEAILEMRDMIAGVNGTPDIPMDWTTVAGYLDTVAAARPAINVATLVPHGLLRLSVIGAADRVATAGERARMAELAAGGMRDGALGLSTGLTYPPQKWSETIEIVDACRAVAPFGGIYVTHHRDYGADLLGSIGEALTIGREAGVAVHFSHFHVSGKPWRDRAPEVLALLDEARAAGQDVTFDQYPYLAGSTFLGAYLPAAYQGAPPDAIVEALQQPDRRRAVIAELDAGPAQWVQTDWDVFAISGLGVTGGQGLEGRFLPEIAASRGVTIGTLICDLLVENRMQVGIVAHFGNEENVRTIMADPGYTVGTDSILVGDSIHPRAAGTYPRILGTYVREEGVLTLEAAVRAMSGAPADRLGLVERGYVREGYRADLVLFDPTSVAGPASYAEPTLAPVGMPWVFVNGEAVKWEDEMTGARPGAVLRGDGRGRAR